MTREEAIDILVGVIAANSEEENEGRRTKPVTKGEYMAFKGIKRMSHVDPEEPADKDFMGLIDTITENTMASVIVIPYEAEVVSTNTSTKSTNISTDVSTEALKSEPSEDLISRAEAIRAITETLDAIDHVPKWVFDKLTSAIEILPPADRSTDGDLISRAEAIETIELVDWYHQNSNKDMVHGANSDEHQAWYKAEDVYKALEAIPSADRPKGEWVDKDGAYYANCSMCGYQMDTHQERGYFRYCPYCGADMRGEDK